MSKFKVGDIVRFIRSDSGNVRFFKKGLTMLKIYSIRKLTTGDSYMVKESDGSNMWKVREDELELDIKPKFKVGDKVRYLGTKNGKVDDDWKHYFGKHGVKKGDVGVIKSIKERILFVKDEIRDNIDGYLLPCDLELINGNIPTKKLIDVDMEDIKMFDKATLKEAEANALAEIKEEQLEIATSKFKAMHLKVIEAKKRVDEANKELMTFKSKLKVLAVK